MWYSGIPLVGPHHLHKESRAFKRACCSSGGRNKDIYLDLHCQVAFPARVTSLQVGLSKGVPLYKQMYGQIKDMGKLAKTNVCQ